MQPAGVVPGFCLRTACRQQAIMHGLMNISSLMPSRLGASIPHCPSAKPKDQPLGTLQVDECEEPVAVKYAERDHVGAGSLGLLSRK